MVIQDRHRRKPPAACIVTLGCPKNEVDSASMGWLLTANGYVLVPDPTVADIVIVNTCGFIEAARRESILTLRELARSKSDRQALIAAGCLAELWGQRLADRVPSLDGLLGTRSWSQIAQLANQVAGNRTATTACPGATSISSEAGHRSAHPQVLGQPGGLGLGPPLPRPSVPRVCVHGSSAYVNIADGCRRQCSFCTIPRIKGPLVSRPIHAILDDIRYLTDIGVQEIILVAQDTTDYGNDLGWRDGLAQLLETITDQVPQIRWIRILYAHPAGLTPRLIAVMAERQQVLPYLDLPLQHADPAVLRQMRRPANTLLIERRIEQLRRAAPGLALRTTFIVGFPGESEAAFGRLRDFLCRMRFDHVGVFCYSAEPGTPAARLGDPIPEKIKQERLAELLTIQQDISLRHHRSLVGRRLDVLVEGQGDGIAIGRTYRDAPEIDGLVVITNGARPGSIVPVRIDRATAYDLIGTRVDTRQEEL